MDPDGILSSILSSNSIIGYWFVGDLMISIDLIFSYWFFLWFILYELKIVSYNPKFAVIVGIVEILITGMILLYHKILYSGISIKFVTTLALFLFVNFIIKCIPIYYLWNTTITSRDVHFTFVLFVIYNCYLLVIRDTNLINVYTAIYNSVYNEKPDTPLMFFLHKWILIT